MLLRRAVIAIVLLLVACNGTPQATPQPTSTTPAAATSSTSSTSSTSPKALTLLTYNVLASEIYVPLRTRAVLDILERSQADVIALQEAAGWFVTALMEQAWVSKYHVSTRAGRPFAPGGQLILTRAPMTDVRAAVLSGRQRRTALAVEMVIDGRRLAVATTHMESFLKDGPVRATQLGELFAMVEGADDAILMGDLNFGDGEQPETDAIDKRYSDLWLALRPGEPGFTWNNDDNPIASIGKFKGEPNRRLDRILLRSDTWQAAEIAIVGNRSAGERTLTLRDRRMIEMPENRGSADEPVIEVFPSDHYGLSAKIKR